MIARLSEPTFPFSTSSPATTLPGQLVSTRISVALPVSSSFPARLTFPSHTALQIEA
ncbi:Uncharacterised protein [Mycobacterium tuberculosis]|uniref:Uncharacterized protein n=1 Tax=Mycobacterium tuberculosis TaxID=1773 RepID=A0A654U7S9_MYCTX|nr:Uncharacterised protein [Mycobacterium tuberculosis]CFS55308.1 Uncharacterised protein [Mycobacterium tuberculosis]CPC18022.1 Uncharacterised protein [Mycobacterium tuberculosis]